MDYLSNDAASLVRKHGRDVFCKAILAATSFLALTGFMPWRQGTVLLSQDWESGLGGWTVVQDPSPNPHGVTWQIADPFVCDNQPPGNPAPTKMAAYHNPFDCQYWVFNSGSIVSSPFILSGTGSFLLSVDFIWDRGIAGASDVAQARIRQVGSGFMNIIKTYPEATILAHSTSAIPNASVFAGTLVTIEFRVQADPGGSGTGFYVDNIVLESTGAPDPTIYVDCAYSGTEFGTFTLPFNTVLEGVSAAPAGGTVSIKPGSCISSPLTINSPVELTALGGAVTIH